MLWSQPSRGVPAPYAPPRVVTRTTGLPSSRRLAQRGAARGPGRTRSSRAARRRSCRAAAPARRRRRPGARRRAPAARASASTCAGVRCSSGGTTPWIAVAQASDGSGSAPRWRVDDRHVGTHGAELVEHQVGERGAGRGRPLDRGVDAEQGHEVLLEAGFECSTRRYGVELNVQVAHYAGPVPDPDPPADDAPWLDDDQLPDWVALVGPDRDPARGPRRPAQARLRAQHLRVPRAGARSREAPTRALPMSELATHGAGLALPALARRVPPRAGRLGRAARVHRGRTPHRRPPHRRRPAQAGGGGARSRPGGSPPGHRRPHPRAAHRPRRGRSRDRGRGRSGGGRAGGRRGRPAGEPGAHAIRPCVTPSAEPARPRRARPAARSRPDPGRDPG